MWALLARYEWALMGVLALGFGLAELVSINRTIRRDKQSSVSRANPPDGHPPPDA